MQGLGYCEPNGLWKDQTSTDLTQASCPLTQCYPWLGPWTITVSQIHFHTHKNQENIEVFIAILFSYTSIEFINIGAYISLWAFYFSIF